MRWLVLTLATAASGCGPATVADSCSSPTICPRGGSYQLCTSDQATDAYYRTSDGARFDCVTASDCAAATDEVVAWCQNN